MLGLQPFPRDKHNPGTALGSPGAGMPQLVLPVAQPLLYIFWLFKKLQRGVILGSSGGGPFFTGGEPHPLQPLLSSSATPSSKPKRGLAFLFPFSFPPFLSLFVLNLLK